MAEAVCAVVLFSASPLERSVCVPANYACVEIQGEGGIYQRGERGDAVSQGCLAWVKVKNGSSSGSLNYS